MVSTYHIPLFRLSTNPSLLDKLEKGRIDAIKDIVQVIETLITSYQQNHGPPKCRVDGNQFKDIKELQVHKYRCDAIVLGTFTKEAVKRGLYPPGLTEPLYNKSIYEVMTKVHDLDFKAGCGGLEDLMSYPDGVPTAPYHPLSPPGVRMYSHHGILLQLRIALKVIDDHLSGLDLKEKRERFMARSMAGDR